MAETIKVRREGQIVKVLLNRPEAYNALDPELIRSFTAHMVSLAEDESVRGVVISGEGKAFCAGGDLKWATSFPKGVPAAFHQLAGRFHQGILEIRRMAKPVIAAINGVAAGGGFSLALARDFRVMARSASFKQAYTSAGLSIDGGGTFTLPRLVGLARALEVAVFDRPIPAGNDLLRRDVASAARLDFLLDGPIETLSQAAMVFCLMNPDIHTTVPGVKNQTEAEETARCIDLGPIPPAHMTRLGELYDKGFRG